jgi:WD40 repeat protein
VAELKGHKFGVSCIKFSPNGRLLVSVGFEHDQTLNVWDWQKQVIVSKATVGNKVRGNVIQSLRTMTAGLTERLASAITDLQRCFQ